MVFTTYQYTSTNSSYRRAVSFFLFLIHLPGETAKQVKIRKLSISLLFMIFTPFFCCSALPVAWLASLVSLPQSALLALQVTLALALLLLMGRIIYCCLPRCKRS
jgi:hypothetical protein